MSRMWNDLSENNDPSEDLAHAVAQAVDVIGERFASPQARARFQSARSLTAIVLGSGLGALADKIQSPLVIPFEQIPGFARSTAGGHRGQLIMGHLDDAPLIAMAGRLHRYEGWTNDQIAFPIRVMHALGATRLIASNAAGGVNPRLCVGDLVVIRDHIHWLHQRMSIPDGDVDRGRQAAPAAAATGSLGSRHGDAIYDPGLAEVALAASRRSGFHAIYGTYLATLGPTYETRAEYRMMRRIGADVVGMSTVGEVQTAAELGMRVLALSIVSNVANPDRANAAEHSEVLEAGEAAAGKLEFIVRRALAV